MKKCPKIVRGIRNRIKWLFSGYSYHYTIEEDSSISAAIYNIYDILKNLRDRAYEHLVIDDKRFTSIQFVQTITNGTSFRVKISFIDKVGEKHIIMTEVSNFVECADIFVMILFFKVVPDLKWFDISGSEWNGKEIFKKSDKIIYFNPEWKKY